MMTNIGIDQYTVPEELTLLEKRSSRRFDLRLRGTAVFKEEGQTVERRIVSRNVSGYGAYLVTDACPQIGDVVDIHLQGPRGHKQEEISLGAVGKILRVNRLSGDTFGLAVQFEAITASFKEEN
jgi:hypothetical protein